MAKVRWLGKRELLLVLTVIGHRWAGHNIAIIQPPDEVTVAASFRAKWRELLAARLAADRAFAGSGGHDAIA